MSRVINVCVGFSLLLTSAAPAYAGPPKASPVTENGTILRYNRGVPTLQRDDEFSTITVTPLNPDHGRLAFAVAAFNKAPAAFNLGVESIQASVTNGIPLRILTKEDLVRKAQNRAMWASIGMAVATGLAAGAAASSAGHHYYNGSFATPSGFYHYNGSYTNTTEQMLAGSAVAAGGTYAIATIQSGLDSLVASLNQNVLQTTTVDQGAGYGGMVVIDKFNANSPDHKPQRLTLNVTLNGHSYPFDFDLVK